MERFCPAGDELASPSHCRLIIGSDLACGAPDATSLAAMVSACGVLVAHSSRENLCGAPPPPGLQKCQPLIFSPGAMGCFRSKVFTGVTLQHSSVHAWMVLSAHATGACSLQLVIVIRRSYLSWSSCLPPVLDPPAVFTPLLLSPLGYSLDAYGLSLVSSECCCWAGDLFIRVVSWSRSELLSFSYHFNIFSFVTTSITVSGQWIVILVCGIFIPFSWQLFASWNM